MVPSVPCCMKIALFVQVLRKPDHICPKQQILIQQTLYHLLTLFLSARLCGNNHKCISLSEGRGDFCHKPHIFAPYYYCCKWQHARPSDLADFYNINRYPFDIAIDIGDKSATLQM